MQFERGREEAERGASKGLPGKRRQLVKSGLYATRGGPERQRFGGPQPIQTPAQRAGFAAWNCSTARWQLFEPPR